MLSINLIQYNCSSRVLVPLLPPSKQNLKYAIVFYNYIWIFFISTLENYIEKFCSPRHRMRWIKHFSIQLDKENWTLRRLNHAGKKRGKRRKYNPKARERDFVGVFWWGGDYLAAAAYPRFSGATSRRPPLCFFLSRGGEGMDRESAKEGITNT